MLWIGILVGVLIVVAWLGLFLPETKSWKDVFIPRLRYFMALRFQMFFLAFPTLFTVLALGALSDMLRNLFVVGPFGAGVISYLTLLSCWSAMVTWRLVATYGKEQLDLAPFDEVYKLPRWMLRNRLLVFSVAALPLILAAVLHGHFGKIGDRWLDILAAAGFALLGAFGAFLSLLIVVW
ncbi:MAG: hypothetical protein AAF517_20550, partial [Planctomycetota bacterium]